MTINFKNQTTFNSESGNLIFFALVDNKAIQCEVSLEALYDIDSDQNGSSPTEQFEANRTFFENIASEQISSGINKPFISAGDL